MSVLMYVLPSRWALQILYHITLPLYAPGNKVVYRLQRDGRSLRRCGNSDRTRQLAAEQSRKHLMTILLLLTCFLMVWEYIKTYFKKWNFWPLLREPLLKCGDPCINLDCVL